jgi:hypothetical protein
MCKGTHKETALPVVSVPTNGVLVFKKQVPSHDDGRFSNMIHQGNFRPY